MGRPREHTDATRAELLLAARRLLAEQGPAGLGLRGLALQVDTTTRAIYSLFGSKENLVRALYVDDDGTGDGAAAVDVPAAAGHHDDVLAEVVRLTNRERTTRGLRPLGTDARLAQAAHRHSADMSARRFFAHECPSGTQAWDRALAAGYQYRKVAENIAAGQRSAAEVVEGWMNSPGHRANILDGDLTQIGVGYVTGGEYGTYWTQVFGTPR
jgi:uncharacterized protein YkwD